MIGISVALMEKILVAVFVSAFFIIFIAFQRRRIQGRLFRITERVEEVLKKQGITSVDFFKNPKRRGLLSLSSAFDRLEQRVDRLLAGPAHRDDAGQAGQPEQPST